VKWPERTELSDDELAAKAGESTSALYVGQIQVEIIRRLRASIEELDLHLDRLRNSVDTASQRAESQGKWLIRLTIALVALTFLLIVLTAVLIATSS
jgi:hypothetical protein